MNPQESKRVLRLVKSKLRAQELVFVVGLPEKYINDRMKAYIASSQVVFVYKSGDLTGKGVDATSLVIVTSRELANEVLGFGGKVEIADLGNLKRLLEEAFAEPLLTSEMAKEEPQQQAAKPVSTEKEKPMVQPTDFTAGTKELEPMHRLARRFLELEEGAGEKGVGSITLSKLIEELGIKTRQSSLADAGWFEAVIRAGKTQVGGYRSTEKLRAKAKEALAGEESTNPYKRAQALIDSEPAIRERIDDLQVQLAEEKAKLERVAAAKTWLEESSKF